MPRIARVVAPGYPHHIIQRGNRRQKVFFREMDKFVYLKLLKEQCSQFDLRIWAYCLMENHVHLIAVPTNKESLRAVAETNRRYTCIINRREGWQGYLWQGRFASFVMDEAYCYHAIRYVENNPVRAGIVKRAEDYRFSSAPYHVYDHNDQLIYHCFWQDRIKDWRGYLKENMTGEDSLRLHARTGRPLGSEEFKIKLEHLLGRALRKKKPGRKPQLGGHNT